MPALVVNVRYEAYDVYVETDNGGFVQVGTVEGSAAYVDRGQAVSVGKQTVG